jgi:solute carrier family 35, member C2
MFDKERLNFPFPLFTTSMHMLIQFGLASLVLYFVPSLRPSSAKHNSDLGRSRHESEPERPLMSKMFYLTRIGPCGAATGLDIGLGNTSLKFISLTFYSKSPVPSNPSYSYNWSARVRANSRLSYV